MAGDLEQLFTGGRRRDREDDGDPTTGRVTRSDATGVFVAMVGGDNRHPVGPCRGARRRNAAGQLQRLPVGTVVLLVHTDEGPWVAAADEGDD